MIISGIHIERRNIRYLLFRLRTIVNTPNGSKPDKLTGVVVQKLMKGWGHDVSRTKALNVLKNLRSHYESQPEFGGWAHFATGSQSAHAWDVGMYDPEIELPFNLSLMTRRPHKWSQFGIPVRSAVSTRGFRETVRFGLDFFTAIDPELTFETEGGLGMRRDKTMLDGDTREFAYQKIIEYAQTHQVRKWPLMIATDLAAAELQGQ